MENGLLAPNLHFNKPNLAISALISGQVRVPTDPVPWRADYAAVNNFGFGGVNAHVILKSNGDQMKRHHDNAIPQLVLFAGRTQENVQCFFDYLKTTVPSREFFALLHKSVYSSNKAKPYRGYKVLQKDQEIAEIKRVEHEKIPVWYIFNCTANQLPRMLKNLMDIEVFARSVKKSADTLRPYGLDLIDLLTNQEKTGRNITSAYLLIVAVQIALIDILNAVGIVPDGLIGCGVEELLCGYVDGSLTAEQVILAAYWTARTLEESKLEAGTMIDIGRNLTDVHKCCPKDRFPSRHLAEEHVTVSGPESTSFEKLKAENIFNADVEYSLHSHHMHAATESLRRNLEKIMVNPKPRSSRWISSSYVESEWNTPTAKLADACYFVHNLLSPILLHEALLHIPKNAVIIQISPYHLLQNVIGCETEYLQLFETDIDPAISVLSCIGRLYTFGLNPAIEKLYPEVQFPVPKGTPMISPLIKWDHSRSWFVPRWDECLKSSEMVFDVSVESDESSERYLVDHCVDGRSLYPASGYLLLAWKALAEMIHKNYETMPVVFEDITIHRGTMLPQTGKLSFVVYISYIERKFEISEGNSIVCSGRVNEMERKDLAQWCKEEDVKNLPMDANDIYKEFKLRGYEYGPNFQVIIGADIEGNKGLLKWTGEWVTFLDSVLHFSLLHAQERALSLPTRIQKLSIDPLFHKKVIEKSQKAELAERWTELPQVSDESRSFFRVHTGYFSNIPKCIKAELIASWACSQSSVVSSSKR
ncbi:fatty acid synthase [Trichonephila clavipes]|nr:fatty acid synthase [Trichonephila clavipes]